MFADRAAASEERGRRLRPVLPLPRLNTASTLGPHGVVDEERVRARPHGEPNAMRSLQVMVRNLSLVGVAQVLTMIASFLFTVAQARYLGPTRFGELSVALSISAILMLVVDFGLSSKLPRDVAQHPDAASRAVVASFVVRIAIWIAAMPLVWLATTLLEHGPELQASVFILSISVLFTSLASSLASYFQGREQFLFPSVGMVAQRAVAAMLGVTALALGQGVVVVAIVYVIASIVQIIVMAPGMRGTPITWTGIDRGLVASMFRGTAVLGVFWMLGAFYYNIDLVILQRFLPGPNVAWYAAAYRLFGVAISVVMFASSSVLYPVMSRLSEGPHEELLVAMRRSFVYLLAAGSFVAVTIAVDADQVAGLVFSARDYGPAADALRFLAPAIAFTYANSPFFLVLLGMHSERRLLIMAAVLAVLNPLANILTIPLFAQNASAVLTSVTEAAVLIWVILLTPRSLRGAADLGTTLRIGVAIIPVAIVLTLLRDIPFLVAAPLAGLVYVGTGLALGIIPQGDVRAAQALLRRTRPSPSSGAAVGHGAADR